MPLVFLWLINIWRNQNGHKRKCGHDVSAESQSDINSAGKFHSRDCEVKGGSGVEWSGRGEQEAKWREKKKSFFLPGGMPGAGLTLCTLWRHVAVVCVCMHVCM